MMLSKAANRGGIAAGASYFVWGMRILCGAALLVTGYLAVTALRSEQVAGCGGGAVFDCGHVLTSRWARIFGLPVSVPAVLLYGGMLGALWFCQSAQSESLRRRAWDAVVTGAIAAGLAAVWFLSLQMIAIGHLCVYCVAAHLCGLAMCAAVLWWRPVAMRRTAILSAVSAAGVSLMIAAQLLAPPPDTFTVEEHTVETMPSEFSPTDAAGSIMAPPGGEIMAPPGGEIMLPPGEGETEEVKVDEPFGALLTPEATRDASIESAHPQPEYLTASMIPTGFVQALIELAMTGQEESIDQSESKDAQGQVAAQAGPAAQQKQRLVSVSGGKTLLDSRHWPLLGDPDAQHIFVEMFDYTCSHCRATHQAIKGVKQRLGNNLAVIVLPVPLNRACNSTVTSTNPQHADACEIARIAIAVWRVDRQSFSKFHDWLFEPAGGRSAAEARQQAARLVGEQALEEELARPYASQYIAKHVELYKRAGAGALPKLLFTSSTVVGEVTSVEQLTQMIQRQPGPVQRGR